MNQRNDGGRTLLHNCAERGYAKCVRILLEAGADATLKTLDGLIAADLTTEKDVLSQLEHK